MSTAFLCDGCSHRTGPLAEALGIEHMEPRHCYGSGDTPGTKGLIGSGNYCPCECRTWPHQPRELWDVAAKEHPGDAEARRDRYKALMVEHGHIVKREPGQSRNLPCGWPGNKAAHSGSSGGAS